MILMARQPLNWSAPFTTLDEEIFYAKVSPSPLVNPRWVDVNELLLEEIGFCLDRENTRTLDAFSGGPPLEGWDPIAQVYSGHQFGQWAGQLGDGRGLYLGEFGGLEWHLKGAGKTPFSRFGDGRSVLRSAIREYLGSEYMHALGIRTTRALTLVTSDTPVQRETLEQGATLTRLARSHLRIGHFEHFYHQNSHRALRELIEFSIMQLDDDLVGVPDRIEQAFNRYIQRSAELVAQWMAVGFVHGVMNTDNTALSGETLDYGPYGFLMAYRDDYVINHTDQTGRYAYGQQPRVMHWNLGCLAETLTPFVPIETLRALLDTFPEKYRYYYRSEMATRLAIDPAHEELPNLLDALKAYWSGDHMFYPELFAKLLDDSFEGLSRPSGDRSVFDMIRDRWSDMSEPSRIREARCKSPVWMLSHWLLDRVIQSAEAGDYSSIRAIREAIHAGVNKRCEVATALGSSPPDPNSAYHLSCSS